MGTESPVGTHGKVLTGVRTRSLIASDGGVRGAECVLADGTVRRIEARWTLLATGGFQADPELRAEHIHPQARGIALRSNPYSAGDGLRLGLSAGGMFGQAGAGFYGHGLACHGHRPAHRRGTAGEIRV
jgi:succinate dehydrogenase/fumarate reductase flavoprotein subunit